MSLLRMGTDLPAVPASSLPAVSARQMGEVDRIAVDEFGIDLLAMMEQAGSHLAELVRLELGSDLRDHRVIVAVGPGNNGGGGLAAARHLADRGASIRVVLARPVNRLSPAGRRQIGTLLQMSVDCCVAIYDLPDAQLDAELASADVVVDAVLGYRAMGEPHDEVGRLVAHIAAASVLPISLDLPSGIDPDTGVASGPAVTAAATMTLGLPKTGLLTASGRSHAGRMFLADIGLPAALYARVGLAVDTPFALGRILRLEMDR
jgi:NAD(P)H-hydrate epimerase